MSEIKEKINSIMVESCEFANAHSIKTSTENYQMLENGLMEMKVFIESNYIPKEDYDVVEKGMYDEIEAFNKLKQENERVKKLFTDQIGAMTEDIVKVDSEYKKLKKEYSDYCDANNENPLRLAGKEIEKLKEENERLKSVVLGYQKELHNAMIDYNKIEASIPELMKKQRSNCNEAYLCNPKRALFQAGSEAILNAPEPSIEDLNKE